MTGAPLLPLLPDGTLLPLAALLRWLEAGDGKVAAQRLPPLNGSLPDVLRLGGVDTLLLAESPAAHFRWQGSGGSEITVAELPPSNDAPPEAIHHGDLPAGPLPSGDASAFLDLIGAARMADAAACRGSGSGAEWNRILALIDTGEIPPEVDSPPTGNGLCVWNPLPFARHALVRLSASGTAALRDHRGRIVPTQEVVHGERHVLLAMLPFAALETLTLTAHGEPAADATWEVDAKTLDNGVVRAELDAFGQLTRLCWDGVFADLAGPAVMPLVDGRTLNGPAVVSVGEHGPVRGRIDVVRQTVDGVLRLSYTLLAHEDGLRIAARWDGPGELTLEHPTNHRSCQLHLAGELSRSSIAQAHSLTTDVGQVVGGARWATLGDAAGRGLALVTGRPSRVSATGGTLRIHGSLPRYALHAAARPSDGLNPGQLSQTFDCDAYHSAAVAAPAPFRLADLGGLVPLWVRAPAGWSGELVFADQGAARGRAYLFPRERPHEAWRVDAAGKPLTKATLTREGDGIELDHGANEIFIIRWK